MRTNKINEFKMDSKKRKKLMISIIVLVIAFFVWKLRNANHTTTTTTSTTRKGEITATKGQTTAIVSPLPVGTGTMSPKILTFSWPEYLNIVVTGSDENWTLNDTAIVSPPDGYENRYYINQGQEIRTLGRLNNFNWPSNDPITIQLIRVKIGTVDLYNYGTTDSGLQDETLGAVFAKNVTVAFQSFIFNRL